METEAPAFVSTLRQDEIRQQPGVNLDDRLRSIPGFTLFRRSSSLVANPTTQGVSLRGLGSSGASRTLVLWDGVPLNDPYGGWVYWTRIDPFAIDRIEVSRGAATSVFGDRALSGAIGIFSRNAEPHVRVGFEGGNLDTRLVHAGAAQTWRRFGASANIRLFDTAGYYIIREDRRGRADAPANVEFVAGNTRLDWIGSEDRLFVRLDMLAEHRENGTALTRNSTSLGTVAANYSRAWGSETLSVLGYHTRGEYRANFSAVAADRNSERITMIQRVPFEALGGAGMWRHAGSNWNVLGGADAQRVLESGTERSQLQNGVFLQADATRGIFRGFLGGRYQGAGGGHRFFSPSAGVVAGRRSWRGRASVYRGFRAPTLNELFRPFRAGNAETLANPALRPETMLGVEAGGDYVGERVHVAVSAYRNKLDNIITNVTLVSTPALITRQRQNAAEALTRGVDVHARMRHGRWTGELGYLFADSRFATGERIPQVPRHTGTATATWTRGRTFLSGGVRAFAMQFEDDRNQFVLPGFATVQLAASQRIHTNLSITAEVENLLNREFLVGYSPVPLTGAPQLWRLGIRWDR